MPKIKTKRRQTKRRQTKRRQTRKVKPIVNIFTKARFLINKLKNKLKINNKNSIKKYYRGGSLLDGINIDIEQVSDLKNDFKVDKNKIISNLAITDDETKQNFLATIDNIIEILTDLEDKLNEYNKNLKTFTSHRNRDNKEYIDSDVQDIKNLLKKFTNKIGNLEKIKISSPKRSSKSTTKSTTKNSSKR